MWIVCCHWAAAWLLPANVCLQLMHPVLESLRNTDKQWLIDTLYAFNGGNVEKFQGFKSAWGQQVMNQHELNSLIWTFSTMAARSFTCCCALIFWFIHLFILSFSSAAWSCNTWSQTDAEDPVAVCHGGELKLREHIIFGNNQSSNRCSWIWKLNVALCPPHWTGYPPTSKLLNELSAWEKKINNSAPQTVVANMPPFTDRCVWMHNVSGRHWWCHHEV